MPDTPKTVTPQGEKALVKCESCGGVTPILYMPLFIVLGASCTGKSSLALFLQHHQKTLISLDSDLLWRPEFAGEGKSAYFSLWMELALNICQCKKAVLLFTGGMPEDFLNAPEAKYFKKVYVLGLTAEEDDLRMRLKERPAWRNCSDDSFIESMLAYNDAVSKLPETLSTSGKGIAELAFNLTDWVMSIQK